MKKCKLCKGHSQKDWVFCEKCKPSKEYWADGYLVLGIDGIMAKTTSFQARDLIITALNSHKMLLDTVVRSYSRLSLSEYIAKKMNT